MTDRRPQEIRKDPKNGSYPTVKGFYPHRFVQTEPEPINKRRNPDWSIDNKGIRIVTTVIVIAFAAMIICSVFL